METANHHCSNIILCSLVKSKNVLISSCNHSLPNCMHYNVLFTYLRLIFTYNSGRSRSQPGGGGGVEGRVVGRHGRGFPSYWWGFRGSHPRECWKNEAKRYNLECKSSLCNQFKLRCFSSKIAQNIFIYCLDIITLSVTDGPRRGDCKPISMQNSCRGVWGNFSLHKESTPHPPPPPNLAERVSFFSLTF